MTVLEFSSNGHDSALSDQEKRVRARAAYRADPALTGKAIGDRYGMSEEWGRKQIRAVRDADGTPAVRPAGTAAVPPVPPPVHPTVPPKAAAARHAARPKQATGTRHWADNAVVLAVALVAAAASYGHMHEVALLAGERPWLAWLFPLTVDGLAVAALRRGEQGRWWLVLALAVSVAANVGAQFPAHAEAAGPVVAAWPPLALYGTHKLLRMGR